METPIIKVYYLPFSFQDMSMEDKLQGLRLQKEMGYTHISEVTFKEDYRELPIDEYIIGTETYWQEEE